MSHQIQSSRLTIQRELSQGRVQVEPERTRNCTRLECNEPGIRGNGHAGAKAKNSFMSNSSPKESVLSLLDRMHKVCADARRGRYKGCTTEPEARIQSLTVERFEIEATAITRSVSELHGRQPSRSLHSSWRSSVPLPGTGMPWLHADTA